MFSQTTPILIKGLFLRNTFSLFCFLLAMVLGCTPSRKSSSPAIGHYKQLASYNSKPALGRTDFDALRFLADEESTKKPQSGPSAQDATGKKSGCNPAACAANAKTTANDTGGIVVQDRVRHTYYLSPTASFAIQDFPANSSQQTRAELDYLLQLQQQRTEEDIRASLFYAGVYYRTNVEPNDEDYTQMQRNLFHIGRNIAPWFNADSLRATAKLVANVWKDAEYFMWKYKNSFLRIRPYKLEPKLENLEETNWAAYPSGHSLNSYVNAYLFSELLPEFSSFFVKDAYDMAHSREIIGVHYPSDSESGRILAWQIVHKLFTSKKFKKDFEAAKTEIRNKVKSNNY